MKRRLLRLCVGASSGGHMNQLLKLLEMSEGWPQPPSFYVTTLEALAEKLARQGHVYIIGECNRRCLLKVFGVLIRSLRIVVKEHPDVDNYWFFALSYSLFVCKTNRCQNRLD